MNTLTIVLTDGPYISEYAEMGYKIASAALKQQHKVNIFLYLDAVHILKSGQNPVFFANVGELFCELALLGAHVEACPRCATARGYVPKDEGSGDYLSGIKITSLYRLAEMLQESDKVVTLSR
ncbi:DsrE/DsrF/TusD sulfur relay family protein [uncultured Methanomethylovorans sp.]|uniref:DsrE/DsrF/TusD sulfur relay family protein n=1 Tax=uncultured Methanomethylovorans sp. TaxID=183759 RepID=UPI00260945C3|nr:DsrE family protein [uncultured Methanomethylovorans sp.]